MQARELWNKARNNDISILSDPRVSKIKNEFGDTPLHWLALSKNIVVLKHPDIDRVENNYGQTAFSLFYIYSKHKYTKKQLKFYAKLLRNKNDK